MVNNSSTIRGSFLASRGLNNSSSSSSSSVDDDDHNALPSAAAIAGLAAAAAGAGAGGRGGGHSYYDSFLLSSSRLAGAVATAGTDDGDEEEGGEGDGGGGGGLRHALGVIDRLQEQLRIVRRDKQALEERCYLLQRENASLLGAGHGQAQATSMSALSAAAEMKVGYISVGLVVYWWFIEGTKE